MNELIKTQAADKSEKPMLLLNDTFENEKLSMRDSNCHSEGLEI